MLTKGRALIAALKRRAMTYGEMQALQISTSPQKRVVEAMREDEKLVKATNAGGLVTWRVVRAKKK